MENQFVECNSTNVPKVDFDMIDEFFTKQKKGDAAGTSKEKKSARANYGDKAIGRVQLRRDGNICTVKGKITPEHKLRDKPYNVVCKIDEKNEEILLAECEDCPASQGGCKHRAAFVMWLHRRSEEPSPTEVASYWKKSVLNSVGLHPIPISNLSSRQDEPHNIPSDAQAIAFRSAVFGESSFQAVAAPPTVSSFEFVDIHKVVQGTTSFDSFIEKMKDHLTDDVCKYVEANTKDQAACAKWHLAHYGRITASKFYSISHCRVPEGSLVNSVLGEKIRSTQAMKRGSLLEDEIFTLLKNKFPDLKKCGIFLSRKYPLFGASPDGIGKNYVIEIKCPSSEKSMKSYVKNDEVNEKYMFQIQLQMALTNKEKGYFIVAHPSFETNKEFTLIEVSYNKTLVEKNIVKAVEYYKHHIYPQLL